MNKHTKSLVEMAGFCFWGDEAHRNGRTVDWASEYDQELETLIKLIVVDVVSVVENLQQVDQNIPYSEIRKLLTNRYK